MKKNVFFHPSVLFVLPFFLTIFLPFLTPSTTYGVDQSLCAVVKIEIRQELTLERQAFDAHMRINNGLSNITLKDIDIDVIFTDEDGTAVLASSDPDNTDALFFINLSSMDNISDIDGSGTIPPSTSADIHWLIIPAPGASNGLEQGTLYYVGAELRYTIGGEEEVTEVTPDYIYVKPMPEMTLDYFLPKDVYGDDAFTLEIEPPIPFTLGVRVMNNGSGTARNLKIDSAQPEIIDNELGLLINFFIEAAEVNGQVKPDSLRVDFGDIAPNSAALARWIMTCSLSGQFVEFTADFSHSDELGGELTSLIDNVLTHTLVHDVLVDLPGRDSIRDFLAGDSGAYRVYESDGVDTDAVDQSGSSSFTMSSQSGTEVRYQLITPVTSGFMYVKLSDPFQEQKVIKDVIRSDGKKIKKDNVWLSKTRDDNNNWQYFINLFDVNTPGSYIFIFDNPEDKDDPPVLQFIPDKSRPEGEQVSFIVQASDPDGTIPALSAAPLPAGAEFIDQGDGTGVFDWTPDFGQAGKYTIVFTASDGMLTDKETMVINVYSADGTENAPSIPEILSPEIEGETTSRLPSLVVNNSTDPDGDPISYEFELYEDPEMTILIDKAKKEEGQTGTTSWLVLHLLKDNTRHYWRVRATDGTGISEWAYGSFFVNAENDPPGDFSVSRPSDGTDVGTQTPVLEVTNSTDKDFDILTYGFEVYEGSEMTSLVDSVSSVKQGDNGITSWQVTTLLDDTVTYYWKSIVTDEHGAVKETPPSSFTVNLSNNAPEPPGISSPAIDSEIQSLETELIVTNGFDQNGDSLTYYFEIDEVSTFDSDQKKSSGPISEGTDTTAWQVTELKDNTLYFWRAKAKDSTSESSWVYGHFFVNTENDMPLMTAVVNPGRGAWVQTPVPILSVHHSLDPDQDNLIYHFEIYNDALLTNLIAQTDSSSPEWVVTPSLNDHSWYYWRVQNEDEHGGVSEWMNPALLYVNDNNVDDPPDITLDEPENNMYLNTGSVSIKWEDRDPDSNAQISLYYDTDSAGEDGVLIADSIYEDLDGNDDTFVWDIEGIPDGTYYIYAVIEDETSSSASYSTAAITIDRVPPVVDTAPDEGVYNSVIFVSVSANEPSDIYCTLDNTEPAVDSLVYTDSLEITETTILKCVAVDRAGNISEILTKTFVIDTDNDGMSDKWERDHFGDLSRDGTLDYDDDGLSDSDEYLHKTDPKDKDTDNDGFSDGDEVAAGSDPLDKDSTPSIISFSITEIKQDWDNAGNITITFESESGKEYDIFYKNAFTDSFTLAEKVTGSAESTSWTDDGSYTGSHPIEENERYYKVSHNGSDSDNTVGMFTIMVHEGMNLISLPLIPLSTALEDVLGSQITGSDNEAGADRFWSWTGTGYEFAWLVGGVGEPYDGQWYTGNEPTMLTFEPDKGAWIQIRPGHGTHDIYIVGEVSTEGRAVSINEGMNLIGICYPVSVPLANTNLWESGMTGADNEASSDRIWMWKGTNYDFIWLVDGVGASYDGQWYKGNEPFDGKFEPGRGYWIQVREGHAEFVWEYVKPY